MYIAQAQRIAIYHPAQDTLLALLNGGGFLAWYAGTRPVAPNQFTLSGNTRLGTTPLSATAAQPTNASGVAIFNSITTDANPAATGDATFAFACKSDSTPILNLSVGLVGSGADIIVDAVHVIGTTGSIIVSSGSITNPIGN